MALLSSRPSVTTTRSKIVDASTASSSDRRSVLVNNPSGGSTVYLGGSDVTTSNGITLPAGSSLPLTLGYGDDLWVVAAGSTAVELLVDQS